MPTTALDTEVLTLLRRGKDNAQTVRTLARRLGCDDGQTNYVLRQVLKDMLRDGVPVVSCNRGFFLAASTRELADYRTSLLERIGGLRRDIDAVEAIMAQERQGRMF